MAFFAGATAAHFEALERAIGDVEPPAARILFAAGPREGGWQVVQVWQSKEHLDAFNQAVLLPALAKLGDQGFPAAPQVTDFHPSYLD